MARQITYKHIKFAGAPNPDAPLIDVPCDVGPQGGQSNWQPEISYDTFWGEDWSDWKPEPEPQPTQLPPGTSLLDTPVEPKSTPPPAPKPARFDDYDAADDVSVAPTMTTMATNQSGPPRLPPDELEPAVLVKNTPDVATIDAVFEYLENPPRRQRCVPDEDWGRMDATRLQNALGRMNKMLRHLIKEHRELASKMKATKSRTSIMAPPPGFVSASGGDLTRLLSPWREDENMEIVVLVEKSEDEITAMDEASLRHALAIGRQAREELLNKAEALIGQIRWSGGRV
ncbi:hypothetical protein NA57DRAFT_54624 [Rhizodiscina lignyota]|uniref:Uncharacterized protein n=1 Tax=Rhizodiscina lignyota TaxID=1504668 RepID=A0A9P4IGG8_9PEZI|nr:hypothetical protein NA57DRAFT_54624 [Rhizodiscina lignyota]